MNNYYLNEKQIVDSNLVIRLYLGRIIKKNLQNMYVYFTGKSFETKKGMCGKEEIRTVSSQDIRQKSKGDMINDSTWKYCKIPKYSDT